MHPATPCTPPPQSHSQVVHTVSAEDFEILDQITAPDFLRTTAGARFRRRDNDFDPLIIATAITGSDPAVTRHHYLHGDIGIYSSSDGTAKPRGPAQSQYVSRQKPRHQRLKEELVAAEATDVSGVIRGPIPALSTQEIQTSLENPSSPPVLPKNRRPSLLQRSSSPKPLQATAKSIEPAHPVQAPAPLVADSSSSTSSKPQHDFSDALSVSKPVSRDRRPPLVVQCRARTRVPTPHGPIFLHLYHNNWDAKEHLAVVIDPAQLDDVSEDGTGTAAPPIRSRSLDAQYEGETEMDRITRGAYVGRLSSTRSFTSKPVVPVARPSTDSSKPSQPSYPAPLIRIHSECFTGETIGSMRCDCGEQLDEAMRLIAQPQHLPGSQTTIPGRGAVVYLRQEGRGIGLLEKIKAYNLQDLGHDTVTANLMLGHGADERGYEIAAAILRDLGLGGEEEGVRVLTNNPEKMGALQAEGVKIVERVPMVPRTWKCQNENPALLPSQSEDGRDVGYELRRAGATLIGATTTRSVELDTYLRTKVQRMGHMLDLPTPASITPPSSSSDSDPATEHDADLISQDEDDNFSVSIHSYASTPGLDSLASSLAPSRMGEDGLGTPLRSRSVSPFRLPA